MRDDILQVRSPGVSFYVLRDSAGLYLLDAGFIGGVACLRRGLRVRGWAGEPIRGIIVTHGHLDHILNVSHIVRESGAWVAAPRADAKHYSGQAFYSGWSRITGALESVGKPLFRFQSFTPDRWIDDGDTLGVWLGLRAVHLPGHTPGHMGYYCADLKLLFCADLFASYRICPHLPPRIFNTVHRDIHVGVRTALALDLAGVLPSHCDRSTPQDHLSRLHSLAKRKQAEPAHPLEPSQSSGR